MIFQVDSHEIDIIRHTIGEKLNNIQFQYGRKNWVNNKAADALHHCVSRPSTAMVWSMLFRRNFVFQQEQFQLHTSIKCREIIEMPIYIYYIILNISALKGLSLFYLTTQQQIRYMYNKLSQPVDGACVGWGRLPCCANSGHHCYKSV